MSQILNISFSSHLWISFRIYIKFAKIRYTARLSFLTLNFPHKIAENGGYFVFFAQQTVKNF